MFYDYPEYTTYTKASEVKEKARASAEKNKKNKRVWSPVMIQGRTLTKSWWGKAWNQNLEKYADYSNRIGRGRSYLRAGAVLDLVMEGGKVTALVQGSRSQPYIVKVQIDPIPSQRYDRVLELCSNSIESMEALLAGEFPKEIQDSFTAVDIGLFPTPKEIHFDCSCPDWAVMCKHVAAVLYGIGSRLDTDPLLFFSMRGIRTEDLLEQSVEKKLQTMIQKAHRKSKRVIDEGQIETLFGKL